MIEGFRGQVGEYAIECSIVSHTGKTFDLSTNIETLELIEDVTSFGLSGMLTLFDVTGIKEFLPLIGGEEILIGFSSNYQKTMIVNSLLVTKIAREESVGGMGGKKLLKVFFSSKSLLSSSLNVFSKSYNHMAVSDIVRDIAVNCVGIRKSLVVDGTKNSISFISPNWTPQKAISYLMRKGICSESQDSGYLFFEDVEQFRFQSLGKLFRGAPKFKVFLNARHKNENESHGSQLGVPLYYDFIHGVDLVDESKKGVYGSSVVVFDYGMQAPVTYSINTKKTERKTNLGTVMGIPKGLDGRGSSISFYNDYLRDRRGDGVEFQNSIEEQTMNELRNRVLYGSMNRNALVVGIMGDSSLRVGSMVDVVMSSAALSPGENEKLGGNYFLKTVKYKFTMGEKFQQVLLLTKPMFTSDPLHVAENIGG